jgi:hypothetical protein
MDWRHGNRSILQCSVFGTGERNPKRRNVYIYDLPIHHSKNPLECNQWLQTDESKVNPMKDPICTGLSAMLISALRAS